MTISRTGASGPMHLKMMISGPPKSGKTTLLGTVPNIVIADTEPHANNLESVAHLGIPFKTINSTLDLKDLLMILGNDSLRKQQAQALGMTDIEAVAIDTLDTLQGLMKKERLAETRQTSFLRDDWGWLKVEMETMLQAFLQLPMHVIFVVHTKVKDIGSEKNPKSVILPGLEGAISESIAGMVGYSLLSFRKQELRPDGTPYTKYWLRAEGDETYEFVGTRTAGRLPDIIEPDFGQIYKAAVAGRQAGAASAPVQTPTPIQTTVPTSDVPVAPTPVPEQPQETAQPSGQAAPSGTPPLPANDEPINAAGIQHINKMFDTLGLPFPKEKVETMKLGEARDMVRFWKAIQQDHAEGKSQAESPEAEMRDHLATQGFVTDAQPSLATPDAVAAKVDGTIEEVKVYIGDDLTKIQEAYDLENAKDKPRKSLIDYLVGKGAQPAAAVTQPVAPADVPSVEDPTEVIEKVLGDVEVVSETVNEGAPCEECNNPIDDPDLAQLGKQRFGRWLCVNDYIAETKKPASV